MGRRCSFGLGDDRWSRIGDWGRRSSRRDDVGNGWRDVGTLEDVVKRMMLRTETVVSFLTPNPIVINYRCKASRNGRRSKTARMATLAL